MISSPQRGGRVWLPAAVAAVILASAPAAAQEPEAVLSPRNANYSIRVRLDPDAHLLTGSQVVRWTNTQRRPARELMLHLYWNAWRNDQSTWMREDRHRERSGLEDPRPGDWGWIEIDAVRVRGRPLPHAGQYVSPDDGNPHDRTVWSVPLPRAVAPGETVSIGIDWRAQVPRTFARTGRRGEFYFIAHWFPKLGVYEQAGWNCHQFHAGTEFFSDYGVYDVTVTLPERFVVGATGREVSRRSHDDGTVSHRYRATDVHAFTWTASPDYVVIEDRFEPEGLPPIDVRLLMQPEHLGQADRHLRAAEAAFELYGRWFGPYPYGYVTIVDPAWSSGAGGMEYPTLFTCGTRLFNPPGGGRPEGVTIHEAGHQFWYGIVGNNEFEHAWLDEGINTFADDRVLWETYGEPQATHHFFKLPGSKERGFLPVLLEGFRYGWRYGDRLDRYRTFADSDVQSTDSHLYHPKSGSTISYSKTALWLGTLERHLGWDTLQRILSAFFQRFAFAHPTPDDFVRVATEVGGPSLEPILADFLSSRTFDYSVESVSSLPAAPRGLVSQGGRLVYRDPEAPGEEGRPTPAMMYRSEVVVRRTGGGRFPVDVLIVFEDGSEARHHWNGRGTWKTFVEERPVRLEHATVDPDRVLLLDLLPSNNSLRLEPRPRLAAVKWTARWLVWLQDWLGAFGFFA